MDEPVATGNTAGTSAVLFYCERCGSRVPTADFAAGKARKTDETHALCAACCSLPSKAASAATPPGTRRDSKRMSVSPDRGAGVSISASKPGTTGIPFRPRGSQSRRSVGPLAWIGIGALVLVCAGLALLLGGGEKKPVGRTQGTNGISAQVPGGTPPEISLAKSGTETPSPPVGPVEPKVKDPDAYDPRASVAQSLLQGACEYWTDSPEDVLGYREKLQDVIDRYARTPAAEEAARLLATAPEPKIDPHLPPEESWSNARDLLAAVDLERDTVDGRWERRGNALLSTNAGHHKIELPGEVPREYDLRIVFMRRESNECMTVNLPRGARAATFVLGGWANQCIGSLLSKTGPE